MSLDPLYSAPLSDPLISGALLASVATASQQFDAAIYGRTVTVAGKNYRAVVTPVERRAVEALIQQNANLANADLRNVIFTPGDFSGGTYPAEGDAVAWQEGGNAVVYEIAKRHLQNENDQDISIQTVVFRVPPTAAQQTQEVSGEPNPGQSVNVDFFPAGT